MENIHNLPENHKAFVVARDIDGELWFWGSWDDRNAANEAALKIGGVMIAE